MHCGTSGVASHSPQCEREQSGADAGLLKGQTERETERILETCLIFGKSLLFGMGKYYYKYWERIHNWITMIESATVNAVLNNITNSQHLMELKFAQKKNLKM